MGPDLSNLARERRLSQIEQALRSPAARSGSAVVSVRFRDGRTLRGLARNETTWDLQLQSLDGALHMIDKKELALRTSAGSRRKAPGARRRGPKRASASRWLTSSGRSPVNGPRITGI